MRPRTRLTPLYGPSLATGWVLTNSYKVHSDEEQSRTSEWFQGLWWGSERIWLGDFLRLICSHRHLDVPVAKTEKDDGVYPCAGDADGPLFFSLEGLLRDPDDNQHGLINGKLYELVDAPKDPKTMDVDGPAVSTSTTHGVDPAGPSTGRASPVKGSVPPSSLDSQGPSQSALLGSANPPLLLTDHIFALPDPPAGKQFRLLHSHEIKLTFAFSVIGGRYYPSLLNTAKTHDLDRARNLDRRLMVLSGGSQGIADGNGLLQGGVFMGSDVQKSSRFEMITGAYPIIQKSLEKDWK